MPKNQIEELHSPSSTSVSPRQTEVSKRGRFVDLKGLLFAMFLYAGLFKGAPFLGWMPVDVTLLLAVIMTGILLWTVVQNEFRIPRVLLLVLGIQVVLLVPLLWTEWTDYAARKIVGMFTLTLLAMLFPIMTYKTRADLRRLFNAFSMIALMLCAEGLIRFAQQPSTYALSGLSGTTISLGQACGLAVVWFFCLFVQSDSWLRRTGLLLVLLVTTSVLIFSGARGPVLFLVITLTVLTVLFYLRNRRDRLRIALISAFLILVVLLSLGLAPRGAGERMREFLTGQADLAATQRPEMFRTALRGILEAPLGLGWGGYERLVTDHTSWSGKNILQAPRYYPHNLVLEVFAEGGWLVGSVIVALFASSIYLLGRLCFRTQCVELKVLFGVLIYVLFGSMVSGDINDHRVLFAFVSLSILYGRIYC